MESSTAGFEYYNTIEILAIYRHIIKDVPARIESGLAKLMYAHCLQIIVQRSGWCLIALHRMVDVGVCRDTKYALSRVENTLLVHIFWPPQPGRGYVHTDKMGALKLAIHPHCFPLQTSFLSPF